jgi:hypothetical protein
MAKYGMDDVLTIIVSCPRTDPLGVEYHRIFRTPSGAYKQGVNYKFIPVNYDVNWCKRMENSKIHNWENECVAKIWREGWKARLDRAVQDGIEAGNVKVIQLIAIMPDGQAEESAWERKICRRVKEACEADRNNLLYAFARFFLGKHQPEVRYNWVTLSTFLNRTARDLNLCH